MTETHRRTLNWAVFHTNFPDLALTIGSAFPHFIYPKAQSAAQRDNPDSDGILVLCDTEGRAGP